MKKEFYMELAYKEAIKAFKEDEVPVGCVIVLNDKVIAKAHNKKETKNNALAHAEILCINKAIKKLSTKYLNECEMYVTLEPCMMCTGAIVNSRIKKIYIGTNDDKSGCVDTLLKTKEYKKINHHPNYEFGILKEKCSEILKEFFKNKRKENNK